MSATIAEVGERWLRFYGTIAQATPEQVSAALEAASPMLPDGEGARRLAEALGLTWSRPEEGSE